MRHRSFTAFTVLTLTVGIGGTGAVFSMVQGVLLRPLPYPDADRIVSVATGALPRTGLSELPFSAGGYWHFVDNQQAFEAFGAYTLPTRGYLLGDGPSQDISIARMTVAAFEVLGVMPVVGRLPTVEDEQDRSVVALISHDLWVGRFGSDPSVVGRALEDDSPIEIIGVMPAAFDFPTPEVDVWRLTSLDPSSRDTGGVGSWGHSFLTIGRLKPEVSLEAAVADGERLVAGFEEIGYTEQELSGLFTGTVVVETIMDEVVGGAGEPLLIAFGTSLFVLLIACTNVTSLSLVRAESRARDQAVRVALGADRGRLLQYTLIESTLLTLAGGIGGVVAAHVGTRVLVAVGPASIPRLDSIGVDASVLTFVVVATIGAGAVSGLLPVVWAGSRRALAALRPGALGSTIRTHRNRVLGALVVGQTALALILLVGSGLMIRTFDRLRSADPGFDAEGVVTFSLTVGTSRDRTPGEFYFPLLDRLAAIPRVTHVAGTESLPMTGVVPEIGGTLGPLQVDEFPSPEGELRENFLVKRTTPDYFTTMGIPLLEGREFVREDFSPGFTETAFIISAAAKRKYWPNESALGKRLTWGRLNGPVVGVVGDVHHRGLEAPPDEIIHSAQIIGRTMMIAVRTEGDPGLVVGGIRAAVEEYDPDVPLSRVQTMSSIVADSFDRTSFTMSLLLLGGAIALLLGAVGIYGVISHVARQQSSEMGVRLALGADPGRIRNIVLARGTMLAGIGVALGLAGATALSGVLGSFLFGVDRFDVTTLLGSSAVLIVVAAASCAVPARRAANTSPATALRADG